MKNLAKGLALVGVATNVGASPPFGIAPKNFKVMLSNGDTRTFTVRGPEHKSSNTPQIRGHWGILPNSDIYECSVGVNVCQYNVTHFALNGNLFIVNPDRTTSLVPHPPEEPKPESLATSAKSHFSTSTAVKPLSATPSPTNPPKENKPYGEPSSTPVQVEGPADPLKTPLWSLASIPLIVLTAYTCYRNRKRGQLLDGSNIEETNIEMAVSAGLGFVPLPPATGPNQDEFQVERARIPTNPPWGNMPRGVLLNPDVQPPLASAPESSALDFGIGVVPDSTPPGLPLSPPPLSISSVSPQQIFPELVIASSASEQQPSQRTQQAQQPASTQLGFTPPNPSPAILTGQYPPISSVVERNVRSV